AHADRPARAATSPQAEHVGEPGVPLVEGRAAAAVAVPLGAAFRAGRAAAAGEGGLATRLARRRRGLDGGPRFSRARGQALPRPLEGATSVNGRDAFLQRVRQAVAD